MAKSIWSFILGVGEALAAAQIEPLIPAPWAPCLILLLLWAMLAFGVKK